MAYRKNALGSEEGIPTRQEIENNLASEMASAMSPGPRRHDKEEDTLLDKIDAQAQFMAAMQELVPTLEKLKRVKDIDSILELSAPIATKMLMKLVLLGGEKAQLGAIREILDRYLGKPIERQMNINADVGKLKEAEVDREISRIINKVGIEHERETPIDGSAGEKRVAPADEN